MKSVTQNPSLSNQDGKPDSSNVVKRIGELIRFPVEKTDIGEPPEKHPDFEGLPIMVVGRLKAKKNLHFSQIEEDHMNRIIEDVRMAVSEGVTIDEAVDNNATVRWLCEKSSETRDAVYIETIKIDRDYAVESITDEYGEVIGGWEENESALTDEIMGKYFDRKDSKLSVDNFDNSFLTTYFDAAQSGLKNKLLDVQAEKKAKEQELFDDYKANQLRTFIRLFAPSQSNRFTLANPENIPINVIFEQNGTAAFKLLCREFLGMNNKMLITAEEYTGMLNEFAEDRIVTLPEREKFPSYEVYEQTIRERLSADASIKSMLVSTLSRRGTLFPVNRFNDLCKQHGVNLIADACQSFGKMPHDISADIIIGSIQKGSELGDSPAGFLMLSDDFIRGADAVDRVKNLSELGLGGSYGQINLARAVYASNPVQVGTLTGEGADEIETIGIIKRGKIIKGLAHRFTQLVQAINNRNNNRIEFFNDHLIYSEGKINKAELSPIFECRIKGVTFEQVQKVAQQYGVVINQYFGGWDSGKSFRICFHPFMSNDSIKILGRVLEDCCNL